MKHKIQIEVERTKRGFLGIPKKVKEKKTVVVDDKTYRKLKEQSRQNRPYSVGEMMFYDDMFGD